MINLLVIYNGKLELVVTRDISQGRVASNRRRPVESIPSPAFYLCDLFGPHHAQHQWQRADHQAADADDQGYVVECWD